MYDDFTCCSDCAISMRCASRIFLILVLVERYYMGIAKLGVSIYAVKHVHLCYLSKTPTYEPATGFQNQ